MYWTYWGHEYPSNIIAWLADDFVAILFLILYIHVYRKGYYYHQKLKEEYKTSLNHDERILQLLRFLCVLVILCEITWSLQFLLPKWTTLSSASGYIHLLIVIVGSFYDIILPLIMAIICIRILKIYYFIETKTRGEYIPCQKYIWVYIWMCSEWLIVPIMILYFYDDSNKNIYNQIYKYYSDILIAIEFFFTLFLCDFGYNKIYNMYQHSLEFTHMSLLYENNQKNLEWLLKKFLYTLIGFIFTLFLIIILYILFLFIIENIFDTNTYWIYIHDVIIHNILHCVLYYYVRVDKHSSILRLYIQLQNNRSESIDYDVVTENNYNNNNNKTSSNPIIYLYNALIHPKNFNRNTITAISTTTTASTASTTATNGPRRHYHHSNKNPNTKEKETTTNGIDPPGHTNPIQSSLSNNKNDAFNKRKNSNNNNNNKNNNNKNKNNKEGDLQGYRVYDAARDDTSELDEENERTKLDCSISDTRDLESVRESRFSTVDGDWNFSSLTQSMR